MIAAWTESLPFVQVVSMSVFYEATSMRMSKCVWH